MARWMGRITLTLTVLGTLLGTAGPAHAYVAGQDRIAFARFDGTDASVRTMAYDGSAHKAPVKANGAAMPRFVAASLSADGTKLIYARLPNPTFSDLFVKTIAGGTKRLTHTPAISETSPAWSPNGKRIAYVETDHSTYASLVVAKADGSHAIPIVTVTSDYIWYPSWSPDGTQIAFSTSDGSDEEIYVTTPAGAAPTQLTDNAVNDFAGDWSQDGMRIAFTRIATPPPVSAFGSGGWPTARRGVTTPLGDAYTMKASGTGIRRVTTDATVWGRAVYGPDKTLVLSRLAHVTLDLYSVSVKGGKYRRLTHTGQTYNAVDLLALLTT
jgi:Tol biopolymer transport system component